MINIENSIICSVLEHDFIHSDKRIIEATLDPKVFSDQMNRFFVAGINRLKELDEPICTDTLRHKLIEANKYNLYVEERLLDVISALHPFATYNTFKKYYDYLVKENDRRKLREGIYI